MQLAPTVSEIARSLTGICTSVPHADEGVCARCHGCPNPGFKLCWSCDHVEAQISRPCELVVPISLYEVPSQLHHMLRHYKSGAYPGQEADFAARVVSLLAYFLRDHGACIENAAGGGWDAITTVPSSRPRADEHPLVRAIGRVQTLADQYKPMLELATVQLAHNSASNDGFRTICDVEGDRVLLIATPSQRARPPRVQLRG